jgi:hypothetical protein
MKIVENKVKKQGKIPPAGLWYLYFDNLDLPAL